jgi:hypothetical protein
MKFRNIFWGIILIFAGVLFILQNLGVIYFNWIELWRLWPVILVLWGVSILPVRDWLKVILVLLVLGASISFMLNSTIYWDNGKHRIHLFDEEFFNDDVKDEADYTTQNFSIPYDDSSKYVTLKLEAAAGKFVLTDSTSKLIDFSRSGNNSEYKYMIRSQDSTSTISIDMESASVTFGRRNKNMVDLSLNRYPVWDIDLDAGAASIDFDLEDYKVRLLNIDGGAASIRVRLGDKQEITHMNIDAGASSIVIELPDDAGCKLDLESVLSGRNFDDFEKLDHGKYQTPNFNEAATKIYVDAEAAVSSFSIIRY